jgi:hypothetical protein
MATHTQSHAGTKQPVVLSRVAFPYDGASLSLSLDPPMGESLRLVDGSVVVVVGAVRSGGVNEQQRWMAATTTTVESMLRSLLGYPSSFRSIEVVDRPQIPPINRSIKSMRESHQPTPQHRLTSHPPPPPRFPPTQSTGAVACCHRLLRTRRRIEACQHTHTTHPPTHTHTTSHRGSSPAAAAQPPNQVNQHPNQAALIKKHGVLQFQEDPAGAGGERLC